MSTSFPKKIGVLRLHVYIMNDGQKNNSMLKESEYAIALSEWFLRRTGQHLDLRNPKTFNEKIQWLKLYDASPLKTLTTDKYLVRDWVREKIGDKYLIPMLGVYDNFDDIRFDDLPTSFVIKTNHGSGWNHVVKDKNAVNVAKLKKNFDAWMSSNYAFQYGFELHYKNIKPRIIIEKYIENYSGKLFDWKIWCFNGNPMFIQFRDDWTSDLRMCFFDAEWNKQEFCYDHDLYEDYIPMPDNLGEMLHIARILARDFYHVCVDLYRLDDGKIYFGEMTHTRSSGVARWRPPEWNLRMGELLLLPKGRNEIMKRFNYILPESITHVRWKYYRYMVFSMITFGKKRCHYIRKRAEYKKRLFGY